MAVSRKTTIAVDDELLAQAQKALGTVGLKDTVDKALSEAVRAALRRDLARRLRTGEGFDFSEPVRRAARQWRT
jgi:Arc/MetJ family transcription regulator